MTGSEVKPARRWFFPVAFTVVALVAGVASAYASRLPDGLEFVAAQLGFLDAAVQHATAGSPLAGYGIVGVADPRLSAGLAGFAGTLAVLGVAWVVALVLRRRNRRAIEVSGPE
jgi:hypothetical protein